MTKPPEPEPGGRPGWPTPSPQPRRAPAPEPAAPKPPAPKPPAPKPPAPEPPAPEPPAPKAPAPEPPEARPQPRPPPSTATPALAKPAAVLDPAHLGDIEGAFGRIKADEEHHSGWRRRLVTFLAIVGPGLIVMVGDNDAGGVATYAQAGQNYRYSLLWVLLLLIPVLIVNQEMVVRLGAVTGVGHARLINERFGKFWGWFSVGDLFLLNFLTIVTEFIGVSLAMSYFGVSQYISVPIAAAMLVAITASGSFRRWERAMFAFIGASLFLFVPLVFFVHPHVGTIARSFVVPGIYGGISSNAVLLIIAIVGTTVAPWQLFFQQSNVIDKRITPRFIRYERADTFLGSLVVVGGASVILVATVYAVSGTGLVGHFTDALGVARAFDAKSGFLGAVFALVLLDASIIGAAAVTLSTSYAFGDVFNLKHSLHRRFSDAKPFYASYTAIVVLAAAIVLIPGTPLGLLTTAVQALAGVLLPSASVFLLLLCNDPEVLGPWTNARWLNIVAGVIVGVLLLLSGTLVVTTLFSGISAAAVVVWLTVGVAVGAVLALGWLKLASARHGQAAPARAKFEHMSPTERMRWRMPPLALLKPVAWSPGTKLGVLLLRGYLVVSVLLLIVKAVELGRG
ncbi:MAG TPA: NRAMP family divalent metal transporter [Streptosporangiaceae bacterium]|nr:NRAMP family divalent metal transporter [Streptosporangiaceae bacterium]